MAKSPRRAAIVHLATASIATRVWGQPIFAYPSFTFGQPPHTLQTFLESTDAGTIDHRIATDAFGVTEVRLCEKNIDSNVLRWLNLEKLLDDTPH